MGADEAFLDFEKTTLEDLKPEYGWVNVKDELPKPNKAVECAYQHIQSTTLRDIKKGVMYENGKFRGTMDSYRVTHWRYYSNVK